MSLGVRFSRLPRGLSHRLLPALRYTNLMRAVEMHHLARWTHQVQGWRVLDVGCGHGLYSLSFPQRDAYLLGCDLLPADLHTADEISQGMGLDGRADFVAADAARLPVPEGAFDLVVCNCVLEHVVDDQSALAGMYRALKPGGLLYLSVDNAKHDLVLGFSERLSPRAKSLLLKTEVASAPTVRQGLDDYLARTYSVQRRYRGEDLEATLRRLGFEIVDRRGYFASLGAAHYEAFHLCRGIDPQRGLGRLAYMLTSLILYPFVLLADNPQDQEGYGLILAARKTHSEPAPSKAGGS